MGDYSLSVGRPNSEPPLGWCWTMLSDVARLETGHTPSRQHPEYWGGDIPWIGIKDATENHGRIIFDTLQYTNELGIANSSARVLPANTVCLSRTASVGYVVVMGRPMATSQDFVNWVCSEQLDWRYLMYVLRAEKRAFLRFASGTTHQTIYFPEVKAFNICLPPLMEQRAIVTVLAALDEKIELNQRMNRTLEEMARTLFKSWFICFDPVRKKMEGIGHAEIESEVIFPDAFMESERGLIPVGWGIGPIEELADIVGGSTPNTSDERNWAEGVHAWVTPKDLSRLQSPVLLNTERRISDVGLGQIGSGLLPPGVVLLSSRAPIGYRAIAEIPVAINQGFIAMKPRAAVPGTYLLWWSEFAHNEILSRANGSTFLEISKANFRSIPVVVPPRPVLDAFARVVDPLYRRIVANEREIATLTEIRNSLLPKLISGAIRIAGV